MRYFLTFDLNKQNNSASVVDGKLILSFPHAKRPIVWQMDLTEVKASSLEVQEHDGSFCLFVKTAKGENIEVAPFETKEEAVDGLMAASSALSNAHGQIRTSGSTQNSSVNATHAHGQKKWGKWITGIAAVIIVLFLINVVGSLTPRPTSTSGSYVSSQTPSTSTNEAGVPVSADDFLNSR